jgi:hypothetical protein
VTDPVLIALLRALPPGGTIWLSADGVSLWPLLKPRDSLELTRCAQEQLQLGDLAVVRSHATLIAHIVVQLAPLRTASIVGIEDPAGLEALARVTKVRRGGRTVPVPRGVNLVLRHVPGAATVAKRLPLLRALVRKLRD